jgi:hypothetical protein
MKEITIIKLTKVYNKSTLGQNNNNEFNTNNEIKVERKEPEYLSNQNT